MKNYDSFGDLETEILRGESLAPGLERIYGLWIFRRSSNWKGIVGFFYHPNWEALEEKVKELNEHPAFDDCFYKILTYKLDHRVS